MSSDKKTCPHFEAKKLATGAHMTRLMDKWDIDAPSLRDAIAVAQGRSPTQQAITLWMSGKNLISSRYVQSVAQILQCSTDDLLNGGPLGLNGGSDNA